MPASKAPTIVKPSITTSLFPKDGGYLVPVKDAVRRAEGLEQGDVVTVQLTVAPRRRRPMR